MFIFYFILFYFIRSNLATENSTALDLYKWDYHILKEDRDDKKRDRTDDEDAEMSYQEAENALNAHKKTGLN